jgi:osmotically-inducible protein OsmY
MIARLAWLAIAVCVPLAAYAQVFQIDSIHGVVRLRGQVAREVQKDIATQLIARIDGVKEVRSELTLSAPPAAKQR